MNFLQSKNWRATKQALGNKTYEVGEYFFHTTALPVIGKTVGYMPRVDLNKVNWSELTKVAREAKCVYITIDPENLKSEVNSLQFVNSKGTEATSGTPVHLQHTVMIDLSKSEEELLAAMKQKHRYNLNLAKKKDVKVKIGNEDSDFETFIMLYQETVLRQKYHGRSSDYLRTVWNNFRQENAFIATAYFESVPIVSWFVIAYGDTLTYVYGGSSEEYKSVMAPYMLEWELVELGRKFGYKYLDLFGIKADQSDGFSRFKVGFTPEIVEFADTVDLIMDKKLYKGLKIANKVRSKILFRS